MNNNEFFMRLSCLFLCFGLFSSCASFDKKLSNEYIVTRSNIDIINGVYKNESFITDSLIKQLDNKGITSGNFLSEIDRKLIKDTLYLDTLASHTFGVKILNKRKLKVDYIKDGFIYRQIILNYKLKKDGYVYLKNKNIQPLLIPYLAGALDITRTRLTVTKEGNLLFDIVNHRSGAFLLVCFLDGSTSKFRYVYSKIK